MKKILPLFFAMISSQLIAGNINWTSPTTLSTPTVNASSPLVVVDPFGNSTAAWIENGSVITRFKSLSGSWASPVTISSGSGASNPQLVVDNAGTVTVVWQQGGLIVTNSVVLLGIWGVPVAISGSGASSPQLATYGTGYAVAVWARNGFIETSTKAPILGWGVVNMISSIGSESNPCIAVGTGGTAVALWHTVVSGNDNIYFSRKTISGGTWSTSASAVTGASGTHVNYPQVSVDGNGNAVGAWFNYSLSGSNYSNVRVVGATLSSSLSSWTVPTQLSGLGYVNPLNLSLNVGYDGNGNAIALWTNSYDGYTFAVESAQLQLGGSWDLGGALVLNNLYAFKGDVVVVPYGDAISSYMYFDGSNATVQTSESTISGPDINDWSIPVTPSTGSLNGYPQISATLSGTTINAASAWLTNNGTYNVVDIVTGNKTIVLSPTGLSVTQNSTSFGVFTDYYNTVSWTASASPNIIKYAVYRNGVFVTSVNSSTFTFVDHNQTSGGSVTYGIGAIDSNSSQSIVATINYP